MLTYAECLVAHILQILGQFNLGFIIARLDDDLYILDQHACDEKYRYETLQKTTTMNSQPLVVPKDLELEVYSMLCLMVSSMLYLMLRYETLQQTTRPALLAQQLSASRRTWSLSALLDA